MRWQLFSNYCGSNRKLIGILFIVFIIHLPLIFNDFHTDDFMVLEITRSGLSSAALKSMENPANFRPLVNLIVYIRYWLLDSIAGLWYVFNILLHLLATALIFVFARRQTNEKIALLAALFFGLYFQHFEAVLWLYGIVRLIAAICVLAALYYYHEELLNHEPKNVIASYLFFLLGLLCVEDVVLLSLYFGIGVFLYSSPDLKRRLLFGAGFFVITGVYLAVRIMALGSSGDASAYFGFGSHIWNNIIAYSGWLVFPRMDHPYILPFVKTYIPALVSFVKPINLISSASAFGIIVYILIRGSKAQKQILLFTLIALLPTIFFNRKISAKLMYIPSIGAAILAAGLIRDYHATAGQFARKIVYVVLVLYFIGQSTAIILTINYYRVTQNTVTEMLDKLDLLRIDWNRYEYMLFNHVPGRARLGSAFHYRKGTAPRLIEYSERAENPPDLAAEKGQLKAEGISYIEIDFSSGQPVVVDSFLAR
jgi:hypothetical protein